MIRKSEFTIQKFSSEIERTHFIACVQGAQCTFGFNYLIGFLKTLKTLYTRLY